MRAYDSLVAHFEKINHFEGARSMLHWDGAAMMPAGGAEARSAQVSALSVLIHQLTCDPRVLDWLNIAEAEVAVSLSSSDQSTLKWAQSNLFEIRQAVNHASAVPEQLIQALSETGSKCEMVWREARADDDFKRLQPYLEEVLKLTREVAHIKADALKVTPYEALLDQYEPGASESSIDAAFAQLSLSLPQLIEDALAAQEARNLAYPIAQLSGPFSIQNQRALGVEVMGLLGFDFNHGRLDVSHHPFCGGTPSDVRITTRYNEQQFTQSLMGVIHETGHALYEQGLPHAYRSQPVGKARGMSVHESQSLFWEMQIGRSEAFISVLAPLVAEAFAGDPLHPSWSVEGLRREYTKVERSLIRVDADEVTYPAHVILRYNLERNLLNADLEIADLPEAWNAEMERLVGITPPSNRDGCMQDIHWMDGAFGYFPTYTLGAMTAAQLFETVKANIPDVHEQIRSGELQEVLSWLRDNVHTQGCRLSTDELLNQATGRPLEVTPFLNHLRTRYIDEVTEGLSRAPAPFTLAEEDVELSTTGVIFTQEVADNALELVSDLADDLNHSENVGPDSFKEMDGHNDEDIAQFVTQVGSFEGEVPSLSADEAHQDMFDLDDLKEIEYELDGGDIPPEFIENDFDDIEHLDEVDAFESFDGLDLSEDGFDTTVNHTEDFSTTNQTSTSPNVPPPPPSSSVHLHEPQSAVNSPIDLPQLTNREHEDFSDISDLFDEIDDVVTDLADEDEQQDKTIAHQVESEQGGEEAFDQVNTQALMNHLQTIAAPQLQPIIVDSEPMIEPSHDEIDSHSWSLEGELKLAEELSEALEDLDEFSNHNEDLIHQSTEESIPVLSSIPEEPEESSVAEILGTTEDLSSNIENDSTAPPEVREPDSTDRQEQTDQPSASATMVVPNPEPVIDQEIDDEFFAELAANYLSDFDETNADTSRPSALEPSAIEPTSQDSTMPVDIEELAPLDLDLGVDPGPSAYEGQPLEELALHDVLTDDVQEDELNSNIETPAMLRSAQEAIDLMDSYQPLPGSDYRRSRPVQERVQSIIQKTSGAGPIAPPSLETDSDDSLRSQSQTTGDHHPALVNPQEVTETRSQVQDARTVPHDSIAKQTAEVDHSTRERDSETSREQIFKLR
jgi:carboxypeptidase Taq